MDNGENQIEKCSSSNKPQTSNIIAPDDIPHEAVEMVPLRLDADSSPSSDILPTTEHATSCPPEDNKPKRKTTFIERHLSFRKESNMSLVNRLNLGREKSNIKLDDETKQVGILDGP